MNDARLFRTDAYKFAMAESGWPLRRETFYYSHRKGGPQVLPVNVCKYINDLLPVPGKDDYSQLRAQGYDAGPGFKTAILSREISVSALPSGSIFYPREPVFSVTGPSALVSWLEAQVLQLNYRIQLASMARFATVEALGAVRTVTCSEQAEIVRETLDWAKVTAPVIVVESDEYYKRVLTIAKRLVASVEDSAQLFEVGLRAATCWEQHSIALSACREAGITKTSVAGVSGMKMVGTTGHEHVQRCGSDIAAVWNMHDRIPGPISCLPDTWDTMTKGVPAAHEMMQLSNRSGHFIRYDSGDKAAQAEATIMRAKHAKIRHGHIFEDGLDAPLTVKLEELRKTHGFKPEEWLYGYGRHLVADAMGSGLHRDRVAAVYKLSMTGLNPTMKFGNAVGRAKQSLPGMPVVFRRVHGEGPLRIVGQSGEAMESDGYVQLTDGEAHAEVDLDFDELVYSRGTRRLIDHLSTQAPA